MNTSANETDILSIASESRPQKTSIWQWVVLAVLAVHLSAVLIGGGWDYVYNIMPRESYQKIYQHPWLEMNVRSLKFENPSQFSTAEKLLQQKLSLNTHEARVIPHYLLAELYNTLNRPREAISEYRKTIKGIGKSRLDQLRYREFKDNSHAAMAMLYYEAGHSSKASQELAQISELPEKTPDDDKEDDNPNELLSALKDTLEAPERGDFHLRLGQAYGRELRFDMASREGRLAETLSHEPQTRLEASHFLKVEIPQDIGDFSPLARYYGLAARSAQVGDENLPKAAQFFQKALREEPGFDWGYNELAIIYRQLNDYPQAITSAQNAIARNVNFYNPYLTLGDIALDQKRYESAIHYFQTAKTLLLQSPQPEQETKTASIENQIAYAYEVLKNKPEARKHYRNAATLSQQAGDETDADFYYASNGLKRTTGK
jgi:Tfp pilus assembly protein PilF